MDPHRRKVDVGVKQFASLHPMPKEQLSNGEPPKVKAGLTDQYTTNKKMWSKEVSAFTSVAL